MLLFGTAYKYGVSTLRATNQLSDLAQGFPITLEVSHLKQTNIDLLYSLIEIWLRKNCKSPWTLEEIQESRGEDHKTHSYIRLVFQDPREAVYYKLSPSYLHNRTQIPFFLRAPCVAFLCQ